MVVAVEVLDVEQADDVVEDVVVEQDAAQHALLGLEILRGEGMAQRRRFGPLEAAVAIAIARCHYRCLRRAWSGDAPCEPGSSAARPCVPLGSDFRPTGPERSPDLIEDRRSRNRYAAGRPYLNNRIGRPWP